MRRPNVIYLNSHDTGRHVSPYGHAVETPAFARFAEEGVLFRQAFSAAPTCSPSRAALLTGLPPHEAGMLGLAHRGFALKDYGQHVVTTLKQAGYHAALAGFQHVERWSENRIGYDEKLPKTGGGDEGATAAANWLRDRSPDAGPFYLEIGLTTTHRTSGRDIQWHNGRASPTGDPRFVRVPAPLPDEPEVRRDYADFAVAVARLDRFYDEVLTALDEAGHAGNTLVIITTDHGIAFPRMKCSLSDHGTGVLLAIRGPKGSPFRGGRAIDALVDHLDVFPTICDACGIAPPPWLRGRSLTPLADGTLDATRADALHDATFSDVTYHAAYEPKRSIRTPRWRYERRFDPEKTTPVLPNCDPSISKDLLRSRGWAGRELPRESLFDLTFDPTEACNVVHDPANVEVLNDLRNRLVQWMRETGDPLLFGPVPVPPGASVNCRDGLHPTEDPIEFPDGGAAP